MDDVDLEYSDLVFSSHEKEVRWAINHDWDYLKGNWKAVKHIVNEYIDEHYDVELAKFLDTHPDIGSEDTLSHLRSRGEDELINNVLLRYFEDEDTFDDNIFSAYGDYFLIEKLIEEEYPIDGVIANKLEIYEQYQNYIDISPTSIRYLIMYGYPEVAKEALTADLIYAVIDSGPSRDIDNKEMDYVFNLCLNRIWGQKEMIKVLIDIDGYPRNIEINNLTNLQLSTVETLFNEGYELVVDGWELLEINPEVANFMIDNYQRVDIVPSIKKELDKNRRGRYKGIDTDPENYPEVLKVIEKIYS